MNIKKILLILFLVIAVSAATIIIFIVLDQNGNGNSTSLFDIFPLGTRNNGGADEEIAPPDEDLDFQDSVIGNGRLQKFVSSPTAGFTSLSENGEIIVRYVDGETGHIFDIDIFNGQKEKISNNTVLKVQETLWGQDGNKFLLRYYSSSSNDNKVQNFLRSFIGSAATGSATFLRTLRLGDSGDDVKNLQILLNGNENTMVSSSGLGSPGNETNFFGSKTRDAVVRFQEFYKDEILKPVGLSFGTGIVGPQSILKLESLIAKDVKPDNRDIEEETKLTSISLPNLEEAVVSPDKRTIFYLTSSNGSVEGKTANFDNNNLKTIFSSQVSEWTLGWPHQNTISLLTTPSNGVPGYLFTLSTNGEFDKTIGPIDGLTALLSPDRESIFYTESARNITSFIYNTDDKTSRKLSLTTFADKCVWSAKDPTIIYCAVPKSLPTGNYPDVWYQGRILFSDNILKINRDTGREDLILDQRSGRGEDIDIVDIMLSENEEYLIFRNKKDSSLWRFEI